MTWTSNAGAPTGRSVSARKLGQQRIELFRAAATAVHPAVIAGGPAQRDIGVPADQDRDRLGGRRRHLGLGDVVELAVVFEVLAGGQAADDVDALVHPLTALGERHPHQVVVLRPRAGADTEAQPVAEHRGQRAGLLGHQGGRPDRQFEDEEVEFQFRGDGRQRRCQHEGLNHVLTVQELPVPVGRVGVARVRLIRVGDAVGDRHRVVPGTLGGARQRDVVGGVGHGLGVGEPHGRDTRTRSSRVRAGSPPRHPRLPARRFRRCGPPGRRWRHRR